MAIKSKQRTTKKSPKKKLKKTKKVNKISSFVQKQIDYLEMLIKIDQRSIAGDGSSVDELFKNQLKSHTEQLATLKGSK